MIMGALVIFFKNKDNILSLLDYINRNRGSSFKKAFKLLSSGVD